MYSYRVEPEPFALLNLEDKEVSVKKFHRFLNSLTCPIIITISAISNEIEEDGDFFRYEKKEVVISSQEKLEFQLSSCGFNYFHTNLPSTKILRKPSYIKTDSGEFLKTYIVTSLPDRLVEGFLSELYSLNLFHHLKITITPVEQSYALTALKSIQNISSSLETTEFVRMFDTSGRLLQSLRSDGRLFEISISITLSGGSEREVEQKERLFKHFLQSVNISATSPRYIQHLLFFGKPILKFVTDTISLGAFYPFISSDLIEPGGVFLGINQFTETPVFLNVFSHPSYDIIFVGKKGYGKSFAAKLYIERVCRRLEETKPSFFSIDVLGEQRNLAQRVGAEILQLSEKNKLGLDPLRILDNQMAVDFISKVSNISDFSPLKIELRSIAKSAGNTKMLLENSSLDLRKYLSIFDEEPWATLFEGEPNSLIPRDKLVFDLSGVVDENVKNAIILLVLMLILRKVADLPKERRKVLFVDEAWIPLSIGGSKLLDYLGRVGRHQNLSLLLSSQLPSDFLSSQIGMRLIQNCDTKVIFHNDPPASEEISRALNLSEAERRLIQCSEVGEGLMVSGRFHIPVKILGSEKQLESYNTGFLAS
jgi:hypothetical protein